MNVPFVVILKEKFKIISEYLIVISLDFSLEVNAFSYTDFEKILPSFAVILNVIKNIFFNVIHSI